MRRLVLVRHAPAEWPEGGEPRYRGWGDAPLGERGVREAKLVARRLSSEGPFSAVFTSDLSRARATAETVSAGVGAGLFVREGLREMSFGEWEGAAHDELAERDGDLYRRWLEDPMRVAPPGGETLAECDGRAWREFEAIRREAGDCVVVVGHGGPLRLILCRLLGMPPENHWRLRLDHSGVSRIEWSGDVPVLRSLNDLSHLEGRW